ncbi:MULTISPECIES: type III secretion system export apparatus subunit SctS [Gammaproteobacteria]|uniref:type III secretion system export apparatus subunit SctS n=1 Tax=Gammaproteobacteria TaxID=1236 RepID=UPI000C76B477|nr:MULTISPECIES: type III secretion system export apparatus subunit SctS [Gammaproteobacteria]MBO9482699.1 type III secretion system export apparatus subunit SctS [Salinisphaera sp. G21_0]MBO9492928.1 type III secretion system export apparatus subunit SctS [Thalassotalea sp. G20_0]WBA83204.1 type III secretion system export apparatus subunit SctS [Endozoicomonas sp. GU-1]WBA86129.1 type III secretion system export apparatus subunit SctS [Endozoicomonas sp. GU-1]
MHDPHILTLTAQALWLTLLLSMPPIIAASAVGLLISLIQALTQIQEQTLPFAFKLVAVIISIFLTSRWMGIEVYNFSVAVMDMFERL